MAVLFIRDAGQNIEVLGPNVEEEKSGKLDTKLWEHHPIMSKWSHKEWCATTDILKIMKHEFEYTTYLHCF